MRLDALPQCQLLDTSECAGLSLPQSMQPAGWLRIPTPCRSGAAPPGLCCLQTIVEAPRHRCLGSTDCLAHDLSVRGWLSRPLLCRSQEHDAVCSRACAILLGQGTGVGAQTQPHGPGADLLVDRRQRVAISLCQALAPPVSADAAQAHQLCRFGNLHLGFSLQDLRSLVSCGATMAPFDGVHSLGADLVPPAAHAICARLPWRSSPVH